MVTVFIHGVPDTAHVWDDVRKHLDGYETLAPNLPGFSEPVPAGFECTKEGYVAWLTRYVEALNQPVNLVGHDWGAILVQRTASLRPDLIRGWAVGGGPIDESYEWHSAAKTWQTEGAGERWWASKGPSIMGCAMFAAGVPWRHAFSAGRRIDHRMTSAILTLYRSARFVGREWSPELTKLSSRGLVFWGAKDPFCPPVFGRRLAERTGATFLDLNCGHWTPQQRPADLAAALRGLISS